MTEEELILELKAHTRKGAEALYDQYAIQLYRIIALRVKDPEQAEQALLEVFQTIWQEAGDYDALESRLAVWMMAIARRVSKKSSDEEKDC